jgi:hypothetical protein
MSDIVLMALPDLKNVKVMRCMLLTSKARIEKCTDMQFYMYIPIARMNVPCF